MRPPIGTWECLYVTPDMARTWLETMMARQRPLNTWRLRTYIRSMRAGDFAFTHQGIAFKGDELHDGQHRLTAIVETGISQWLWVYRYQTTGDDVRHQIDRGFARTDANVAHIAGRDVSSSEAAVIRIVAYGRNAFEGLAKLDASEWLRIVDTYMPCVEFLHDIGFRSKSKGMTVASILGAIGRAKLCLPEASLRRFAEVYISGQPNGPHESAALRLRELALQIGKNADRTGRRDVYLKACSALKAFAAGKPVKILRLIESPEEPLPLPATE